MRVGLMVGSDKERSRADRLNGLLADGKAAEDDGFASFWIPQVPGYLDAMTAVALLGHVTDRIEIGTAVVPMQTRHPLILAQQALTTQVACAGRFALGVGPSHHWIISDQLGLPYDKPARLVRDYLDVLDAAFAGPARRRRQRQLLRAQPGRRHRRVRGAGARRGSRADDAANRRRPHRRNRPVDGRRAGHRRLCGASHHRGGRIRGTVRNSRRGRRSRRALLRGARSTPPGSTPAKCSGTPTSPRTMSGCSNTVMPKTSETRWPRATRRPCSRACAATVMPASQISRSGWSHSATTRSGEAHRVGALNPSWHRWFPNSRRTSLDS